MIPKIIHYCWLSNDPIPGDLQKYMRTWKKKLPDYEFMLWDTKRFDLNSSVWVKQAFENKKYAFAADYIRLYALYHYGGIYLDTDVEVLKSYNPLLHLKIMVGFDHMENRLEAATWGAEKGASCIKVLLDFYADKQFVNEDGSFNMIAMPELITDYLKTSGFTLLAVDTIKKAEQVMNDKVIPVFPRVWFCPQNWYDYKLNITKDTYSIHHYKGAWLPDEVKKEREILRKLGPFLPRVWRKIQALLKRK